MQIAALERELAKDSHGIIGRLDNDGHRGAITVAITLAGEDIKKDMASKVKQLILADPLPPERLDSGQEPPSSQEEHQNVAVRGLLINYNFKISDMEMGTIIKDKGLRLALGG